MPDDIEPEIDPELANRIDEIHARYAPKYAEIEDDAQKLSEGAPEGYENAVGINIDWTKWHDISFDVPEFRMKLQTMSFDVPEVTMKTQRWVWDTPVPIMTRVKIGEKPEFHGFTIRWTPIYMDVPSIEMRRSEVKLDVPEFKMSRMEIKAHIPEIFRMRRVSFRIPEITIRKTEDETEELQHGAEELEKTATELAAQEQGEVKSVAKEYLSQKRNDVNAQYQVTLAQYNESIAAAVAAGVDPSKPITGEDGVQVSITAGLDQITTAFETALKQIDDAIAAMDAPIPAPPA